MFTHNLHTNCRTLLTSLAALALVAGLASSASAEGEDLVNGAGVYKTCVPCHGETGLGRDIGKGPSIAGLPQWYVEKQLGNFQSGARGAHPDDAEGLRMRPMARTLMDHNGVLESKVKNVAAYVASLEHVRAPATIEGDPEKGKALYTPCIACHGPAGQGSQPLGGPPLAGQSDWYLVSSLHKFQGGIRGGNPSKDQSGAIMAAMSKTLTDEKIQHVIAYIRTLGN